MDDVTLNSVVAPLVSEHDDDGVELHDDDGIEPEASEGFVSTPYVEDIVERALAYLEAGYPIHLAGPAGTGKTTLAFHIAAQLERPVTLIHGDDEFVTSDLIGRDSGYRTSKVIDNFIHSVLKTEEEMRSLWGDNRLTTACRSGHTLIYDEFTRSRPEANNVLLSVLEEKVLNLPRLRYTERAIWKCIRTSGRSSPQTRKSTWARTRRRTP